MLIAEKADGDPAAGKVFFTALCLSCHKVGDGGAGFAPALDGSAHRENEALLTSILDPDAAMESAYALFRIIKKDGSSIEGYMESRNDRGTTLRFMGGASLFTPIADIKSQRHVPGRSVMPKGLMDALSDEQIANLLAYIKTIK